MTAEPRTGAHPAARSALEEFVARAVPHGRHPVRLPARVTAGFWTVAGLNVIHGAWLVATLAHVVHPGGPLYLLSTLAGHPRLALVLAATCVGGLGAVTTVTRGLTRADLPALVAATVAGTAGVVAVAGAVLAIALVVTGVVLLLIVALAVLSALFSSSA